MVKFNIGVEGFTYSQYARRGFNELLMVAFFSLLMIVGLSIFTKRESQVQKRVYSGFSVALAGLVLVILVSSYQRLMLAIDWHGFSRLRLYPRVFLVWVGLLFIAVVLLEIFHQERFFIFAALLASLGFAVSLSLINVDASIVRHNLWRATQGKHLNVQHLASLSTDAVPALVDEFSNPALSTVIREGVGAAALCYTQTMQDIPMGNWRYFNYSHWRAAQALDEIQDELAGYRLNVKKTLPVSAHPVMSYMSVLPGRFLVGLFEFFGPSNSAVTLTCFLAEDSGTESKAPRKLQVLDNSGRI